MFTSGSKASDTRSGAFVVSTSGDGIVRTAGTDDGTAEQRAARRKLARIVKQIAVRTTVPRIEEVASGRGLPRRPRAPRCRRPHHSARRAHPPPVSLPPA